MYNDYTYSILAADRIREFHRAADNDRLVRATRAARPRQRLTDRIRHRTLPARPRLRLS